MIEQQPRQIDLTTQAHASKLERRGDIFMPEPGGGEAPPIHKPLVETGKLLAKSVEPGVAARHRQPITPERQQTARESWTNLYGKDLTSLPSDERQTVEAAISLGYGPSDRAGKSIESPTAKEVIDNSSLSEPERIVKAEGLLHRELSPKQREALLKAHSTGVEVFANTRAQLAEKVQILKAEGFTVEEIRTVIESGLAATGPTIDRTGIADAQLLNYIDLINKQVELGYPQEAVLLDNLKDIMLLTGVNGAEKSEVLRRMDDVLKSAPRAPEIRQEGLYGERKLTPSEKRRITSAKKAEELEDLFNRMFDRVDTRPQAEFSEAFGNAGTFEFEEFMKTLNEEITTNNEGGNVHRARDLNLIVQQFANEKKAREVIHNAYYAVMAGLNTEKVSQFIEGFLSGWADMAFNKPGVTPAMHFYEQALLIVRESAGGYLKPAEVVGEMKTNSEGKVNELARELLNKANAAGEIKNEKGEPLEPWQIDRALAFARGMSIVTGRTIEIAASSILPPGAEAFSDQYAQRIIAELAPFRHAFKFYTGSKFSRVLAYTMNRGRKPWTTQDIEDFAELTHKGQIDVLNALVPEGKERFYSILNPLEIGGILSRTGWRLTTEGGVSLLNELIKPLGAGGDPNEAWIGTGVQIEQKRGKLVSGDAGAVQAVEHQLIKMGERTPLRLFLNIRSVQEEVLRGWMTMDQLSASFSELVLLQEKANQAKQPLDSFINGASDTTKELVARIRNVWNRGERESFLKTLKEKEWATPYTFGTDDVPYDQYSFETTGPRSVARRWSDMASAATASKALGELVSHGIEHFSSMEDVIKAIQPIYDGIKNYNEEDAKKFTSKLAEGIMKFYGKDYKARLPLGIGSLMGIITGESSYAQIAYGRGAMAWDELQLNEFTRQLRDKGMLNVEQQHELQNKAGGGKKEVVWSYIRTVVPLIMLGLAFYMFLKVSKEERG